jgi:cobyric acid synthase
VNAVAKVIMVQGTTSNAGKSFLAAALCRIFKQDGYSVAPFKSQNMALNSFITDEGLEMGRAQVMQAEAAGIKPSVRMNPILLKPTGDTGSQVIVNGKVRGDMTARAYFAMKRTLIPDIMEAYNSLAAEHDIIVIEGPAAPRRSICGRTISSTWAWRSWWTRRCCCAAILTGAACSPPCTGRWPCCSPRSGPGSRAL